MSSDLVTKTSADAGKVAVAIENAINQMFPHDIKSKEYASKFQSLATNLKQNEVRSSRSLRIA